MGLRTLSWAWLFCLPLMGNVAGAEPVAPPEYSAADLQKLMLDGKRLLTERGRPKAAIDEAYDPVINYYKRTYADPEKKVYTARTTEESLYYLVLASINNKSAIVLDSTWSDAYLMKGYASLDLGELEQAHEALSAAIELAPNNPQYLSEMGFWHQVNRDMESSLVSYKAAAEAAEMISNHDLKVEELTRALRGQGYALVEMQRLDEAEVLYNKCLVLNKKDDKARNELAYIKKLRQDGK